jgi:hypothetical protein
MYDPAVHRERKLSIRFISIVPVTPLSDHIEIGWKEHHTTKDLVQHVSIYYQGCFILLFGRERVDHLNIRIDEIAATKTRPYTIDVYGEWLIA